MKDIRLYSSLNEWIQYKWNPNLKESFLHKYRDLYNNFQGKLRDTEVSVSALLPDFIDLYQNAASSMKRVMRFKVKSKQNASWWDKECSKARYLKNNSLRHFRQTNSSQALDNYLHRQKHYT